MAIYERRQPDFYGDLMEAVDLIPDPVLMLDIPPQDGREHKDSWGTVYVWKPGSPGPHPRVTPENAVIPDMERWEECLHVPDLDHLDWTQAEKAAEKIDRKEKFAGFMFGAGLFERTHHLMGMENALVSYLEYPEEMAGLLRQIAEYKKKYIRLVAEHCHPDLIFYHDDWGCKQNLFLPPAVWRRLIKPLQKEISDTIHDCGMIYMHHADCICQPIVTDMVEIGVDIWQGVIAQNDIPQIQRITQGKLAMCGGIDGPKIDIENISEEAIRKEVRRAIDTYCAAGRFFPSIPNGICFLERNNRIVMDELKKYGRQYALEHPVQEQPGTEHSHGDHPTHQTCVDHHHHHHPEGSTEKYEGEGQEGFSLESHIHQGASVVSGTCTVYTPDPKDIRKLLMEKMEQLADWVREEEGYIGHIKSGFSTEETESFSVTDRKIQVGSPGKTVVRIHLAAIVFGVSQEELKEKVKGIFWVLTGAKCVKR